MIRKLFSALALLSVSVMACSAFDLTGITAQEASASSDDQTGQPILSADTAQTAPPSTESEQDTLAYTHGTYEEYTLFAPLQSTTTYLIDLDGQVVHSWEASSTPGNAVYLLENGNLLRTASVQSSSFNAGGVGGRVEEYTWDGELVWSYEYAGPTHNLHHDIEMLPDGNVLMIAWELKSAEEAIGAGRDPALLPESGSLWVDHIIEVDPATDEIV